MSTPHIPKHRRVIPRLRKIHIAVQQREAEEATHQNKSTVSQTDVRTEPDSFLLEKLADWKDNRGIGFAADLVCSAFVSGFPSIAQDAAEFIIKFEKRSPQLIRIAELVLGKKVKTENDSVIQTRDSLGAQIHVLRHQLSKRPYNPLGWIELSRLFAIVGEQNKAKRSISAALRIAPNHRLTLRSASRLYIHTHDLDNAAWLLQNNPATPNDPWLIAAEIAASMVAGLNPRYIKRGRQILASGNFANIHLSEISASLGTFELHNGARRAGKKLLTRALVDGTENSIAQVEWDIWQNGLDLPIDGIVYRQDTHEAKAWNYYSRGYLEDSLKSFEKWHIEEPFSDRPTINSSFLSGILENDYTKSKKITEVGLMTNPQNESLLNGMAFYLASEGRPQEALRYFSKIRAIQATDELRPALSATAGLIAFRSGSIDMGKKGYLSAITHFESLASMTGSSNRSNFLRLKALALLYFSRELLLNQQPEAHSYLQQASVEANETKDPAILFLLKKIESLSSTNPVLSYSPIRED